MTRMFVDSSWVELTATNQSDTIVFFQAQKRSLTLELNLQNEFADFNARRFWHLSVQFSMCDFGFLLSFTMIKVWASASLINTTWPWKTALCPWVSCTVDKQSDLNSSGLCILYYNSAFHSFEHVCSFCPHPSETYKSFRDPTENQLPWLPCCPCNIPQGKNLLQGSPAPE